VVILVKDLKELYAYNEELYKETTQILTLDNFRGNEIFLINEILFDSEYPL